MFEHWQKVCVFLTRRCNLRCRGCNVVNHQSAYEFSTDEWKKAFDIMKRYKVGFIVLFGGEPTLRDDLPELVEHLNKIEMPHTIITNGIRLLNDSRYYNRILEAKPFGISASVNHIDSTPEAKFGDQKKSNIGHDLLLKLKEDAPDVDLVANMAVTRENIRGLPDMVRYFTSWEIWSILSFFHVRPQRESMYWWYRGPVDEDNKDLVFRIGDEWMVSRVAQWFIDNYDGLFLHNQKDYFKVWPNFGIKQNWHCSEWVCPAVNPDGSLMACIDRPLSKPLSIFDLPNRAGEIYQNFEEVISACPGCFWDHMYETNKYASESRAEIGKKKFSHQSNKDI